MECGSVKQVLGLPDNKGNECGSDKRRGKTHGIGTTSG